MLENNYYRLSVDKKGAVNSVYDKVARRELIAEPHLAENWRLLLPTQDKLRQANYVVSGRQAPPRIKRLPNGLELAWPGPLVADCGKVAVSVQAVIRLVDERVEFSIAVENNSPLAITEIWFAGLGGLMGVGERTQTETMLPCSGAGNAQSIFRNFPESMGPGGGGGFRATEYHRSYPGNLSMPWFSLFNPRLRRGVYYACHDEIARIKFLRLEMHPTLARNRVGTNWPTAGELAAMRRKYPAGVVLHWVHTPFLKPGAKFQSAPVVLQCHPGDWHRAASIYREWFTSKFALPSAPGWLRRAHAVLDIIFMLPEGNITHTFKDLPRLAREAARYGVKALLVSGWWVGGHDNQYPNYAPDRRLGTWEDLRKGIAACHELGVKVYFFANVQTVDLSTAWYRKELHKYRAMKPNGFDWWMSFGMGTLLARCGDTAPPLGNCEPAFPEYRRIIVRQMRKLAELGADGVHFDKAVLFLDCNPRLKSSPDRAMCEGLIQCLEETLAECRKLRPDFCLGVESSWDRLLPYCDAWWNWIDGLDHVSPTKYAFPEWLPTCAAVQACDYNTVNNAVRFGYQLLLGPAHWSESLHDEQTRPLSRYIREVLRIRKLLEDTLYFGEFLDRQEAAVQARPNLQYNTFRNPRTGRRACVLANQALGPVSTTVRFDGNLRGRVALYRPFAPVERKLLPSKITLPGETLAVVVEE